MLTATLYSVGISAFVFLLPVFAKDVLAVGPIQLGWLWSALGVGMLIASFALASIAQRDFTRRLHLISLALGVGGLAVGALRFLEAPLAAGFVIAVIGVSTAMFTPLVWTTLQELTPAPLLGRVFTSFATGGMAASMAGMAGFGWATDMLGPGVSLGGISFILLITAVAVGTVGWYRSQMAELPPNGPGAFAL
jgi:MFS family permease